MVKGLLTGCGLHGCFLSILKSQFNIIVLFLLFYRSLQRWAGETLWQGRHCGRRDIVAGENSISKRNSRAEPLLLTIVRPLHEWVSKDIET